MYTEQQLADLVASVEKEFNAELAKAEATVGEALAKADKYKQIFIQGANPFSYLGFFIDKVGHLNYYQEHNGMKWSKYQDLVATNKNFDQKYWNRAYQLSEWITCYDWIKDDGYNNFANWIEEAK